MRKIKVNKCLILIVFFAIGVLSMGASSWLIINEQSGSPSFQSKITPTLAGNNPSFGTVQEDSENVTFTTAIMQDEINKVTVDGNFYYGTYKLTNNITKTSASQLLFNQFVFTDGSRSQSITKEIELTFKPTNTNKYNEISVVARATINAVSRIGSLYYGTISKGLAQADATIASKGGSVTVVVIPGVTCVVKETLNINSNVSLDIPYLKEYANGGGGEAYQPDEDRLVGTTETDSNGNEITKIPALGSSLIDSTTKNVAVYRKTLINMRADADIIISTSGSLRLGGEFKGQGVSGYYNEINLDSKSFIECYGNFECYGYVKEYSNTAKNGIQAEYSEYTNNSFDSNRYIKVFNGGILKTGIGLYDLKSGGTLSGLNDNGICPLNIFDFPSLQTFTEVEIGGKLQAVANLVVSGQVLVRDVIVVSNNSGDSPIFLLQSGSICFEYSPADILYSKSTNPTKIYINGKITQKYLNISLLMGQTINTQDKFLPISYKYKIYINSGAVYNADYKVKFLPGSILKNCTGGTINLNSEVIFYENSFASNIQGGYPTSYGDAQFINNGELNITANGAIGAFIQTEVTDDSATVNFEDGAGVSVSSPEGMTIVNLTKVSEGYFYNDTVDEFRSLYQFVAPSEIKSSTSGYMCWEGEKDSTYELIINVLDMGFTCNVLSYTVSVADDASGTNSENRIENSETGNILSIAEGKYVKITVLRANSATFNDGTILTNEWILVNKDLTLNITPNEGVIISFSMASFSGAARTTYTVSQSATKTGTYTQVEVITNKGSVKIIKGYWFKVESKMGTYDFLEYPNGVEFYGQTITGADGIVNDFDESLVYQADQNYSIYYNMRAKEGSGGGCVATGTMITLADGTQKAVENITESDILLVFDHESGQYVSAPILFIERDGWAEYNVINLEFSNGTTTKLIYEHALFDLTLNKYVYITESNYGEFVGHEFAVANSENNAFESVTLTRAYVATEYTGCYSLVTAYHLNYFIDGMLSIPGGITGLFNYFEYGEGLKYDEEQMQADIEKYGLYTYEDFKDYVSYEVFEYAFAAKYFKVSVGKGLMTYEDILALIERYVVGHDLNKDEVIT